MYENAKSSRETSNADTKDLQILLSGKHPITVIETFDELRARDLLIKVFKRLQLPTYIWTCTKGLEYSGLELEDSQSDQRALSTVEPEAMLKHIRYTRPAGAYILCDFHPFLEEPKVVRFLKEIALHHQTCGHRIVLLSHQLALPAELKRLGSKTSLSLPSEEEIYHLVREEAREWANRNRGARIKTDQATLNSLVRNLKGLTHQDVRHLAHGAISDDGAITESDLQSVTKSKFALMDMEGVLHYEYDTASMADLAGLQAFKQWLEQRKPMIAPAIAGQQEADAGAGYRLDQPRGVLLFGVQGGGKSLAAKAVAGALSLPLLRLDMGALYNKYIGETERNLRDALALADLMHPCVLWIDEIEKGLAEDQESGVSKRVLGTLLTWMAEHQSRVFLVATSNDISALPPELIRKGRFDEVFFVDLPCPSSRHEIFCVHMRKRSLQPEDYDLNDLVDITEGFTGAEIEQAIVSAMFHAVSAEAHVDQVSLRRAIEQTQPLSVLMREKLEKLQSWAELRAVRAN